MIEGDRPSAQAALAEQFDAARRHLRTIAFRMLGSLDEAEDAVQDAWLRASRADARAITNLTGWFTTIVGRVCLDMLRARRRRREDPADLAALDAVLPDARATNPEAAAALADEVGLALLVVLDSLNPPERVAFVLHDLFGLPFDEIAAIVDRTTVAAKKLASRARHRVQGRPAREPADFDRQRTVVEAFLAASRAGDLQGLLAVLDPDVVRRVDTVARPAGVAAEARGARRVAEESLTNTGLARFARIAPIDGRPGLIVAPGGRLLVVLEVESAGDRVTAFSVTKDPARLRQFEIALIDPASPVAHAS